MTNLRLKWNPLGRLLVSLLRRMWNCTVIDAPTRTPQVGVGVFVFDREGRFLLGKRIGNSHGAGEYSLPGGHVEMFESPEEAARREVYEETGLTVRLVSTCFLPFSNDIFIKEQKHYITLYYIAIVHSGRLRNCEPHKTEDWQFYDDVSLPQPVFPAVKLITEDYRFAWNRDMAATIYEQRNRKWFNNLLK